MKGQRKVLKLNRVVFLSIILFLSSVLSLAQTDDFVDEDDRDIEALEGQLENFRNSQEQVVQKMSPEQQQLQMQLQQAISSGDQKEIQALTKKLSKTVSGKPTTAQLQKMVGASLQSFQSMSDEQLRAHLLTRTAGNPVGVAFGQYPKLLDFLVKLLRDPVALPQFFSILNHKTKLMIFFAINLVLFFVGFLLKKAHKAKGVGLGTHFKRWFVFFSLRLIVFLVFFHTEVGPFFFIARDTFL